ncbi:hypothetical protein [Allonocardiopsis opalescens]|uniref:hypothetical protein n=1 Tax=Allonocardiopsis opalescens TaxID=1144618 RepID=UPI0011B241E6|nr:hypothetical protein [Allonocardiopsis opalescens]
MTGPPGTALDWVEVPIGLDAERWATRGGLRRVLVLVHTVTAGQRVLDVVGLLEADLRVQVVFTQAPDVFGNGVREFLRSVEGVAVSWQQAAATRFDLAIAASTGGIDRVHAPLVLLPHGAGFNKLAGGAPSGPAPRDSFGLDRQRLVRDGRVLPSLLVLAHEEERRRLAHSCPEALPAAAVLGDPAHDRLVASLPFRRRYRTALGLGERDRLIVLASTWDSGSLLGRGAELVGRLLAETGAAPRGHDRVVMLLHPNAWYAHGGWQIRAWLAGPIRAGLRLLPPEAEWRAVLCAADVVIGDHGSATLYATLTGAPVVLSCPPSAAVAPESPMAALAAHAPVLDHGRPLLPQLAAVSAESGDRVRASVAHRITSAPGEFAARTRTALYRLLGLTEPGTPARLDPVPALAVPVPTARAGADRHPGDARRPRRPKRRKPARRPRHA